MLPTLSERRICVIAVTPVLSWTYIHIGDNRIRSALIDGWLDAPAIALIADATRAGIFLQLIVQQRREQVVIAVPAPHLIERSHEQIGGIEMTENPRAVGPAGHGIAQFRRELAQN